MSDLISRSALMREIGATVVFSVRNYPSAEIRGANKVIDRIKAAPAVDAVPVVHGRWEWDTEDIYMCSNCCRKSHVKEVMGQPDWDFCPVCGAKMDGETSTTD